MFPSLEKRGFTFGQQIGRGSTSIVLRSTYRDKNGTVVDLACKVVDKMALDKSNHKDFLEKFFPREIELIMKLNHPNIIGIHAILESKNVVFVFQVFAENGDLLRKIQKAGRIEEKQARLWYIQLLNGLGYLHNLGYAHRDIKCENIFLSRNNNIKVRRKSARSPVFQWFSFQIGDFGYSRRVDNELSNTFCGSRRKETKII
jgi:testis-specific serine kinase